MITILSILTTYAEQFSESYVHVYPGKSVNVSIFLLIRLLPIGKMSIIAQLHIEHFPDLGVDAIVEEDEREERENANADEIRPVSAEDDVPGGKERKGGITNTNIDDRR